MQNWSASDVKVGGQRQPRSQATKLQPPQSQKHPEDTPRAAAILICAALLLALLAVPAWAGERIDRVSLEAQRVGLDLVGLRAWISMEYDDSMPDECPLGAASFTYSPAPLAVTDSGHSFVVVRLRRGVLYKFTVKFQGGATDSTTVRLPGAPRPSPSPVR